MYYFFEQLIIGLAQIFASLFSQPSLWWLLGPLIFFWLVLEVYFGVYKGEQLGWNTALGNGMSLLWINVDSMRFLWEHNPDSFGFRFLVIISLLLYGFFIIYISFSHKISSKVTYALASPSPIYYLSCVSVLWGHALLVITGWVFLDLILLYGIVLLFFYLLRKYLPSKRHSSPNLA